MPAPTSAYATDHSSSVLSTHRWRTLSNSTPYILPYLQPHLQILDIGCGPGSITIDLARHVPAGNVTGIENVPEPLVEARRLAEVEGVSNVSFEIGDVLDLKYEDESFDFVHVHQVLQHVSDPVRALSEMRRVVRKGGIVACRESAGRHVWFPDNEILRLSTKLQVEVAKARGGNPHPGDRIHVWARQAGFEREGIKCSTGSWCFSKPEEREYWGESHAARMESSGFAKVAVDGGFATTEQLAEIAKALRDWVMDEDAWYGLLHGEIVCRK